MKNCGIKLIELTSVSLDVSQHELIVESHLYCKDGQLDALSRA